MSPARATVRRAGEARGHGFHGRSRRQCLTRFLFFRWVFSRARASSRFINGGLLCSVSAARPPESQAQKAAAAVFGAAVEPEPVPVRAGSARISTPTSNSPAGSPVLASNTARYGDREAAATNPAKARAGMPSATAGPPPEDMPELRSRAKSTPFVVAA